MVDCAGVDSLVTVSVFAVLSVLESVEVALSPHDINESESVAQRRTKRIGWFIV
jgi:hypothetical protein